MAPISTKSTYFNVFIYIPYIPNLKEIAPAVPEIRVPETRWIFFVFFFFAPNNKSVRKLCFCAPISTKFGAQVALTSPQNLVRFAAEEVGHTHVQAGYF